MPTWITLKADPDELVSNVRDLAHNLGTVLERDKGICEGENQKSCIALMNDSLYTLSIGAFNPMTKSTTYIQVD